MWHKAIWKGYPMRLELTRVGLLVENWEMMGQVCRTVGRIYRKNMHVTWFNMTIFLDAPYCSTHTYTHTQILSLSYIYIYIYIYIYMSSCGWLMMNRFSSIDFNSVSHYYEYHTGFEEPTDDSVTWRLPILFRGAETISS